MKNYLLTLRFIGTAFHGSQRQTNASSVQEELEKALLTILRERITVRPCSRTDAGVHANMFCCNFFTEAAFEPDRLVYSLNAVLPRQIAVYDLKKVSDTFSAQKSCSAKEYIYKILNSPQRNPFFEGLALHFSRPLDSGFLDAEAKAFIGEHDFAAFCASGSSVNSTVRTVFDASVRREGELVIFSVRGNGFLYNMVRIMVGTLLDVSDGKIESGSIPQIIERKERSLAGVTAPATGLYLNKVFYPENI